MPIKPATDLITPFAHTLTTGEEDLDFALRSHQVVVAIPTDVAGTAYAIPLVDQGRDILVTSVTIVPGAALTSNDTNYKTLSLKTGDKAGGALSAAIAQKDTRTAPSGGTGNWVARTAISLFAGRATVAAASTLYLEVAVTGSGVALTGANFVVNYQVL